MFPEKVIARLLSWKPLALTDFTVSLAAETPLHEVLACSFFGDRTKSYKQRSHSLNFEKAASSSPLRALENYVKSSFSINTFLKTLEFL